MPKVLVIDDEQGIRRLVRAGLTARGYEVVEAASGQEGLLLIEEQRPELILLDLGLPLMSGWAVLEEIQKRQDSKEFAVLIITSSTDQDIEGKVNGLGFTALLEKPFRMDDLYESVQRALAGLET